MKKFFYISASLLFLTISACEKTEFVEVVESPNLKLEAEAFPSESNNLNASQGILENNKISDDQPVNLIGIDIKKNKNISIKEVSDGDDEADNGDDSKTN